MRVRNELYDRGWKKTHTPPIPVVSVGNLTVGGTGKTPTVVLLARWFRERGYRVAILSRGYGAGADGRNDEARELETKLDDVPHLQNPDRVASAAIAVEELDMQVLLLDDGFQHRRIGRRLDIVLLDATNPFGYNHWLPRGLLRESPRSLRRAQVVMLTRCNLVSTQRLAEIRTRVQRFAPNAAWVETEHRPTRLKNATGKLQSIESLSGKRCLAFCAIGNPDGFFETVKQCGVELIDTRTFPDHHSFTGEDMTSLVEAVRRRSNVDMFLCTGKDLAKLHVDDLAGVPLWAVDIDLVIRFGQEAFEERLNEVIG